MTRSKILLSAMNVPVRPAPALQCKQTQRFLEMNSSMNRDLQIQNLTVISYQKQNAAADTNMTMPIYKSVKEGFEATCSVRQWDGSQTVAAVSALRR